MKGTTWNGPGNAFGRRYRSGDRAFDGRTFQPEIVGETLGELAQARIPGSGSRSLDGVLHRCALTDQDQEGLCAGPPGVEQRSDAHTSELQSLMRNPYAVFCLKQNKT